MMNVSAWGRFVSTALILLAFVAVGYGLGISRTDAQWPSGLWESNANAMPSPGSMMDAAARGEAISLVTGQIEPNVEALFGLDHLTGNLFCWIVDLKSGQVGAVFSCNVRDALGNAQGDADYAVTTGYVEFRLGRTGNERPADCVVYVGEGNSGRIACYTLVYNKQAMSNGDTTAGELRHIGGASMRNPRSQRDQ